MSCNHTKTTSRYVTVNCFGEETEGEWEHETISTTEDIDLHRYRCTQCKKVMYYSGRAREYYEEGKTFDWIEGLKR